MILSQHLMIVDCIGLFLVNIWNIQFNLLYLGLIKGWTFA